MKKKTTKSDNSHFIFTKFMYIYLINNFMDSNKAIKLEMLKKNKIYAIIVID
jgi:hypothetical protein